MNIEKTLAACRAELTRQQEMEKAATPGPWYVALDMGEIDYRPTISNAPMTEGTSVEFQRRYICDLRGPAKPYSGSANTAACAELITLSRNLNPARLRVVESLLPGDAITDFRDSPGLVATHNLELAAALLGVEVK
jgi:hypothetical protein